MRPLVWALALALTSAACGPRGATPVSAFDGRIQDWTREILADSPERATEAGAAVDIVGRAYADKLDDRSTIAAEARRTSALRRLTELRALDTGGLSAADRLTYDVLGAQFEAAAGVAVFEYGEFRPLEGMHPYVLNQLDSAFLTLPEFFDRRHDIRSWADADAYMARLRQVGPAIDAETDRARRDASAGAAPPLPVIDATLTLLDDLIATPSDQLLYVTALQRKLDAILAPASDPAARTRDATRAAMMAAQAHQIVRDQIATAHARAAAFLRSIRGNAGGDVGAWRLPQGEDLYRALLKTETTTDLAPPQIHRIGRERVRELNTQLDIALRRVGLTEGPVGVRLAQLTADPRYRYEDSDAGRAQLLADSDARVKRVLARANQWFGQLPRAPLEVRRVPPFLEASSSGAFYSPPSLDGAAPGIYYINLRNLAEMTRIDLPTQDYHEAVPGHHFQVALAQEQRDMPLLRRLVSFNAFGEGWGLYAEGFADEQGFYENDPVGRIGYLRWQLWRAARLVVDTGLHAGRWTRQQAIDYLAQTTGDTAPTIATEVDRYIAWPGQACGYEIGRREIVRLRERARTDLGPDFDLGAFHDAVLLRGELPLSVLDQRIADWIPEQRASAARERRRP